jgi:pyruvate dehydrogenase E2 component (dihydrolipoamide acetyltransferase)
MAEPKPDLSVPAAPQSSATSSAQPAPQRTAGAPAATIPAHISPAAKRRAHELGVSLEALLQRAAGQTIHLEDVEQLAKQQGASPADAHAAMRAAIGAAMARSKHEIPHYYLSQSVDFGPAQAWLAHYNARLPVQDRLIDAVLITKAVAVAAARLEGFSGHFSDGAFHPRLPVHAGDAIAIRGGGLVAPALLDADRKDLATLMREFSDLVTRVRAGHMRSSEFAAATITVTSLGADGADLIYPIINPPQVAIVGSGAIRDRPWVESGQLVVRPVLTLALGADHRVTDGRAGSRFLQTVAELLAKPEAL